MAGHDARRARTNSNSNGRGAGEGAAPQRRRRDLELGRPALPPLVYCSYRPMDRWGEQTCSVCLSELQDGEAVRVLTACMHCFHATCVEPWLRQHATCPVCRAPTGVAAAAAKGGGRCP